MQRVLRKMTVVVPVTLGIIFMLLYFSFGGVAKSLIVMIALPFSLIGGVWFLWLLGYNTSVAVYLDEAFYDRRERGVMREAADVAAAVREGALGRLRPKIMTVTAIMAGLAPILWSRGTGADVMKRIAAPMVGGMISATVLTLVVIPAIYLIWRRFQVAREAEPVAVAATNTHK
jgi:Cu(I)/Ag(I) efflux system membrane protein CusA/SilA